MSLTDVVSALHLSIFAEVPLLVFFGIFIGLCFSMVRAERRFDPCAQLPLREERRAARSKES